MRRLIEVWSVIALMICPASALRVTPREVEVPILLQEEIAIPMTLNTDLATGVSWQASSDQPFVTIDSASGTAPEKIKITVDQVALATFLSDQDQRKAILEKPSPRIKISQPFILIIRRFPFSPEWRVKN